MRYGFQVKDTDRELVFSAIVGQRGRIEREIEIEGRTLLSGKCYKQRHRGENVRDSESV